MLRLNLGSGKNNLEWYVNIDAIKHTKETVVGNVLKLFYANNVVDEIYSSHVIEHLDRNELDMFFYEIKRVLKKGGLLKISAPCMTTVLSEYYKGNITIDYLDNFLFALHEHRYDFHKQGIYEEKLRVICEKYSLSVLDFRTQSRDHSKYELYMLAKSI